MEDRDQRPGKRRKVEGREREREEKRRRERKGLIRNGNLCERAQ